MVSESWRNQGNEPMTKCRLIVFAVSLHSGNGAPTYRVRFHVSNAWRILNGQFECRVPLLAEVCTLRLLACQIEVHQGFDF